MLIMSALMWPLLYFHSETGAAWLAMVGGIGQSIPDMVQKQNGWLWLERYDSQNQTWIRSKMVGYGWRDRTVNTRHSSGAKWLAMVGEILQSIPDMAQEQNGWLWLAMVGGIEQSMPDMDQEQNGWLWLER